MRWRNSLCSGLRGSKSQAAVLGSLQSAASLVLCGPQGHGLGRRTSRRWLLTRWHSNLPPLVREKSAKTRCFTFFLFLWHFSVFPYKGSTSAQLSRNYLRKWDFFFFFSVRDLGNSFWGPPLYHAHWESFHQVTYRHSMRGSFNHFPYQY